MLTDEERQLVVGVALRIRKANKDESLAEKLIAAGYVIPAGSEVSWCKESVMKP